MNMLNTLLQQQLIDLDTYTELYPESAMPFKAEMKEYLKRKEQNENTMLKQQNAQMQQELTQLAQYSQEQEKAIKDLVNQVSKANKDKDNLKKQYVERINTANQIVNQLYQSKIERDKNQPQFAQQRNNAQ